MSKDWFSAQELLGMPGMPGTAQGIRFKAKSESWQSRKKQKGKGLEYHITSLPGETRQHFFKQQFASSNVVVSAAKESVNAEVASPSERKARGLIALNNLSEKARTKALAKLEILNAQEQFVAHSQRKTEAEHQFDALYNSGEFQLSVATRCAIKQIHWRTLRRWRQILDTQGIAALGGQYRVPVTLVEQQQNLQQFLIALITAKPHLRQQPKALRKLALVKADSFDWDVPSESAIRRWLDRWFASNQAAFTSLTNPDAYNSQHRPLYGRMYSWLSGPNQVWEFDSTPTDVMLNADGKLKRYCVIAAIDVYTRRPTVLVSPSSNSEGICLLLRRCLLNWGMLESDGIARTDNGSDYVSQRVSGIFDLLGISQSRTAPFSGWEKPFVERFFGTLSRALFELLPGYIGHNVNDRQAIESAKAFAQRIGGKNKRQNEAETLSLSLTATQLQEIIDQWIQHDYMHKVSDGFKGVLKGKTPFEVITESGYVPKRIANPHALDVLLNHVGDATVIRGSVKAGGLQYTAPELMESRWDRQRVRVFLDPTDVGRATLYPLEDWGTYVDAYNQDLVGRDIDPAAFREARKQDQKALAAFRRATRELQSKFGIETLAAEALAKRAAENSALAPFPGKNQYTENPTIQALSASKAEAAGYSEQELAAISAQREALEKRKAMLEQQSSKVLRTEHEQAEWLTYESLERPLTEKEQGWLTKFRNTHVMTRKRLDRILEAGKRAQG